MILMIYNMITHIKEHYLFVYWIIIQVFSYLFYIMSALYVVGFVQYNNAHYYLSYIDNTSKIIVSLFLMWKFNFFRKNVHFSNIDRSIVFQCALFLFLTTTLNEILVRYLVNVKNKLIHKNTIPNYVKRADNTLGSII